LKVSQLRHDDAPIFQIEAAQQLADRLRTARHIGRSWTRVQDRDFERETNELQIMAQAGPYRMF
jgi:hypothetical protein